MLHTTVLDKSAVRIVGAKEHVLCFQCQFNYKIPTVYAVP